VKNEVRKANLGGVKIRSKKSTTQFEILNPNHGTNPKYGFSKVQNVTTQEDLSGVSNIWNWGPAHRARSPKDNPGNSNLFSPAPA